MLVVENYSCEEPKTRVQDIGHLGNWRLRGRLVDTDTTNAGVAGTALLVSTAGLSYAGFCSS